jgi:hypothetical protein
MARSFHQLTLIAVCAAFGFGLQAWADPAPGTPPEKKKRKDQEPAPTPASPEFDNVRRALDALTPDQRRRFQENFWRWANLSPEEKKALRDREEMRKKVVEQEIQAAMQEAGLQLDGDRRKQFTKRYSEERRKIEEQLRKETQEKRKPMVKEMIGRLKEEFAAPTVAAPLDAAPVVKP